MAKRDVKEVGGRDGKVYPNEGKERLGWWLCLDWFSAIDLPRSRAAPAGTLDGAWTGRTVAARRVDENKKTTESRSEVWGLLGDLYAQEGRSCDAAEARRPTGVPL